MKKLIFGLIAIVMFSNLGNAQTANRIRPKEAQLCVNLLIITYCTTWSFDRPAFATVDDSLLADKFNATKASATINENVVPAILTISGFSADFEGKTLDGPKVLMKDGRSTKAGQYVVKKGQILVPIEK